MKYQHITQEQQKYLTAEEIYQLKKLRREEDNIIVSKEDEGLFY